jgi:hypothetical protein
VIIIDSREAVLKESGGVILSKSPIYAEVGEIFDGSKPPPVSDTTVFKSWASPWRISPPRGSSTRRVRR